MKHCYFLSLEGKFKAPKLFLSDLTKFVACDNYKVSCFPPSSPLHVVMILVCQLHSKCQNIVDGVAAGTCLSRGKRSSLQDAVTAGYK